MRANVCPSPINVRSSLTKKARIPAKSLIGIAVWCLASLLGAATVNVAIKDSFFSPSSVTVSPGDTVVWTNMGSASHTSTSGSGCTSDGKWDSGTMKPGATFSHKFSAAGNYPYFCVFHCAFGMKGTITVSGGTALSCSASATPTSGSVPLTVNFSGTASGGVSPYSFAWVFGDGGSGGGASISHTYSSAGTFTYTLTVTDSGMASCTSTGTVTAGSAATYSVFLATAARATGAQGTNWKTDAMLYNGGSTAVNFTLFYTPTGMDGTSTPYVHSGTVPPKGAPVLSNFVETLFGLTNSAGSVRITADGDLKLSARVYNDTGSGTYGQWVPGQTVYDAIASATASRTAAPAELIGNHQNSDYRTNIGFSEIAGQAASVLVSVFDDQDNPVVQNVPVALLPFSFLQKALTDFGVSSGDDLRVQIVNQGPGTVLAYSSVVDNHTGDAVFVPAQRDDDVLGETHQIVGIIAKASGAFNTNWVSDVDLYNPLPSSQNISMVYTGSAGSFTASLSVSAQQVRAVHDVVSSLFSAAARQNSSGSLQILSDNGLIVVSRTYNQTSAGTYGQLVPAFNADDPIGPGDVTNLLQVTNTADFRTNIGFSEYSGMETMVSATLFDSNGVVVASTASPVAVPASGNVQLTLDNLFQLTAPVNSGEVEVTVASGGSVYPYISVVDNRTGDAICVPGKK